MEKTVQEQLKEKVICNEMLYKKVAAKTKISPKQVEELALFVSKYANKVIATGAFETIMIPGFGKFRPRERMIQHLESRNVKTKLPI